MAFLGTAILVVGAILFFLLRALGPMTASDTDLPESSEPPSPPPPIRPGSYSVSVNGGEMPIELLPSELRPPRQINAWIEERASNSDLPLAYGESYRFSCQVGRPRPDSLTSGLGAAVPDSDVPAAGLNTEWTVTGAMEMASDSPDIVVTGPLPDGPRIWTARFALHIPRDGDSAVRTVTVTPRPGDDPRLCVALYAGRELYRQLAVRFHIGEARARGPLTVETDCVQSAEHDLNLQPAREWAEPPGVLSVTVFGNLASVRGDFSGQVINTVIPWMPSLGLLAGRMDNVRASAERLWTRWETAFNDVDPDDLDHRLRGFAPEPDWSHLSDEADEAHRATWDRIAASSELRAAAADGYQLFQAVFGRELRAWLDVLPPGSRLDVSWLDRVEGSVSNIPWALMYLRPPSAGSPVDPSLFFGLRFRIGYTAHAADPGSKALGAPARTHRANLLYWGDQPGDDIGVEARRQQQAWDDHPNQVFIPAPGGEPKPQAIRLLDQPGPAPVGVLYFFCECKVGEGNDPVLSFSGSLADRLGRTDLGSTALESRPFVFANACSTASSDPHRANELEAGFFERGCRAFLGTEAKVPIAFASRFATVFFELFERRVDPGPVAAGEALAQTRLFFWTRYRNLGGLLYTYINQYELFLADPEEVAELRA